MAFFFEVFTAKAVYFLNQLCIAAKVREFDFGVTVVSDLLFFFLWHLEASCSEFISCFQSSVKQILYNSALIDAAVRDCIF